MNYLFAAILAWAIFSVSTLIDKFLLNKPIRDPKVYTFYTGVFAIFVVLIFLPFSHWPGLNHFLVDIASGIVFLISLYFLFRAIQEHEVSRVIPLVGALTPIFALLIEHAIYGTILRPQEYAAFVFLVAGTFLISVEHRFHSSHLILPLIAAFLTASYYVVVKFALVPFSANFGWVRLGSVVAAVLMLASPRIRKGVFHTTRSVKSGTSFLFITKAVLSGLGFIVLNYAISIGDPALVNSLQGIEYGLLFIMVIFLSAYFPKIISEKMSRPVLMRKIAAIIFIFIGLLFLQ